MQTEKDRASGPDLYGTFLVLAIAGNVLNRVEAHLKGHPITLALSAGMSVYLCLVLAHALRRREGRAVPAVLLGLAGTSCTTAYYLLRGASLWLELIGYTLIGSAYLVQSLRWRRQVGPAPRGS